MRQRFNVREPKVKIKNTSHVFTGLFSSLFVYTGYTRLGKPGKGGYGHTKQADPYEGKPPISAGRGGKHYGKRSRDFT